MTLEETANFCQAIAPEVRNLRVIDTRHIARVAPAYYAFHEVNDGKTWGITSPGMGNAISHAGPVFAVNVMAISRYADSTKFPNAVYRSEMQKISIHELGHCLCRSTPYHGELPAQAGVDVEHSPRWALLCFALSIRAAVAGYEKHLPGAVVGYRYGLNPSALWNQFRPLLAAWRGGNIEALKAMPLPGAAPPPRARAIEAAAAEYHVPLSWPIAVAEVGTERTRQEVSVTADLDVLASMYGLNVPQQEATDNRLSQRPALVEPAAFPDLWSF